MLEKIGRNFAIELQFHWNKLASVNSRRDTTQTYTCGATVRYMIHHFFLNYLFWGECPYLFSFIFKTKCQLSCYCAFSNATLSRQNKNSMPHIRQIIFHFVHGEKVEGYLRKGQF